MEGPNIGGGVVATELTWLEYSPKFAEHVKGRYSKLVVDQETHEREPQLVEAYCTLCKGQYRNKCQQGMPRNHIVKFAILHVHKAMANAARKP
jgi:hypothetical protein